MAERITRADVNIRGSGDGTPEGAEIAMTSALRGAGYLYVKVALLLL